MKTKKRAEPSGAVVNLPPEWAERLSKLGAVINTTTSATGTLVDFLYAQQQNITIPLEAEAFCEGRVNKGVIFIPTEGGPGTTLVDDFAGSVSVPQAEIYGIQCTNGEDFKNQLNDIILAKFEAAQNPPPPVEG